MSMMVLICNMSAHQIAALVPFSSMAICVSLYKPALIMAMLCILCKRHCCNIKTVGTSISPGLVKVQPLLTGLSDVRSTSDDCEVSDSEMNNLDLAERKRELSIILL